MKTAVARLAPVELNAIVPAADRSFAGLSVRMRDPEDAIETLRDEWVALAGHASEPNAFAEHWFVGPGLRHFRHDCTVRLLEVRNGGALIGILPLCIAPRYGRVPVRHVQNWLHSNAFLGAPLVRAGQEQVFWAAVIAGLDEDPWASAFLHINGLVEHGPLHRGLAAAAWVAGRSCDTVFRTERAVLVAGLAPTEYLEQTVRKKKRKELNRLRNRLAELGTLTSRSLCDGGEIDGWCDAFLALERSGWKGSRGSALACSSGGEAFLREVVAGAFAAGRLHFLRLDLDGRPLAMLLNFMTPPGAFSFKIAFDEDYARFSPGVLIQIENLAVLDSPGFAWMDSCAVEDHPMINSLWADRRPLVRLTVPLAGSWRGAAFRICRSAENLSRTVRRLLTRPRVLQEAVQDDDD
jgi:CelD/BcsL family acetyltransferase involved in cellulose biosynthesis